MAARRQMSGVAFVLEHFPTKWEPVRRGKCDHI
jgi:hypothetical protein